MIAELVKNIKEGNTDKVKELRKKAKEDSLKKMIKKNAIKPMPTSYYSKAWNEYKQTESYKSSVMMLKNKNYSDTQPYLDNVISRIFDEGYFLGSKNKLS